MKKLILIFVALIFLIPTTPTFAKVLNPKTDKELQSLQMINNSVVGERIEDFHADITVHSDGKIDVKETIKYFFDTQKHGIFRYIPFTKYDNGTRYDLTYDFHSVTDEHGKKYKYEKSNENEQWVLKIGDPDKTITGEHTYIISYTVSGALGYFNDHDELYWNVTGNGWDIPIQQASTTITLPKPLNESQIQLACYTDPSGSTKTNCIGATNGGKTTFKTTLFLNSNEGLTVVEGFPKGIVAVLKPEKYIPFFERWYGKVTLAGIIIAAIFWYILLPIWLIIHWYRTGRDPEVGIPVTAGFDPPKHGKRFLTPGETGSLIDETVDNKDLFATIVDLARRGFLIIQEKKKKEFYLLQKKKSDKTLLPFEKTLLDGIFKDSENIKLKDAKLFETVKTVKGMLYQSMVDNKYFAKNPEKVRKLYYALGIAGIFSINLVLAFSSFVFGKIMPRKTLLGAQKARDAHSLKNFLTSQKRQLEFQAKEQMMFEKLLPYAIAFGVEKVWAKRFEKINLKQPSWYQGYQTSSFNSIYFAGVMSNSFSSFKSSSTPSSSGSGFGGGGFSGGGGGGGGGGSW